MDLDEEKSRSQRLERSPFNPEEAEWETKKVLDDYKFKLQKSEQDINTLQTNVRFFFCVEFIKNYIIIKKKFFLHRWLDLKHKSFDLKLLPKQQKGQKKSSKLNAGNCNVK